MIQTQNVRVRDLRSDDLNEQINMLSLLLRRAEREAPFDEETKLIECAIDRFVNSVTIRLNEEEEILRSNQSTDLSVHFAQHRFFATQANLLKIAFTAGQVPLARSVVEFLRTWLSYHVQQERADDMAMVSNI